MTTKITKIKHCRACDSVELNDVIDFGETGIADDYFASHDNNDTYPLVACLCNKCGLLQLRHIVDPGTIYDNYIYATASSPGLQKHFEDYAKTCISSASLIPEQTSVLDIGCNDGILLQHFKALGCDVAGVEPSEKTARHLPSLGIPVFNGYWNEELANTVIASHSDKFSLVTSNNVFANVPDILSYAKAVTQVLREDGIFVIETGYHFSLIENFVFDNIYHEHLSYFSIYAINQFLGRVGMEVFDVNVVPTKGGSIRVFSSFKGIKPIKPVVNELIQKETEFGLFEQATYQNYMHRLADLKNELRHTLKEIKESGTPIIGFGASATVTTVIAVLGLAEFIDFLVDDNEVKHNTYSPGYGLPVYETAKIYSEPAGCVLILPWRFADMFIAKNKQYLENGGYFLKVIPEISKIDSLS